LEVVLKNLGGDDNDGHVKKAIEDFAVQHGPKAKEPIPGLGESLTDVIKRAKFRERGWHASFNAGSEESLGYIADFVSGANSPIHDWQGWRYRSGLVYDGVDQKNPRKVTVVVLDAPTQGGEKRP
jgi:hypothetical protein